ncbi:MAG: RcnB family protein [Hylemonella sp.]|nr:RcnB family protein [Hylemonella sp.]MDH5707467.1 RcnB family protein [Hylemonella sp.]
MKRTKQNQAARLLTMAILLGVSHGAWAEKPEWAGQAGKQGERKERRNAGREAQQPPKAAASQVRVGAYFAERQRTELKSYYREQAKSGRCPPGLAKKQNGCMPPGQARKWRTGQPLPADVTYVPVEPAIQARLGVPPAGHEFVRVASDILLIAAGTAMVIDAIQDLGY